MSASLETVAPYLPPSGPSRSPGQLPSWLEPPSREPEGRRDLWGPGLWRQVRTAGGRGARQRQPSLSVLQVQVPRPCECLVAAHAGRCGCVALGRELGIPGPGAALGPGVASGTQSRSPASQACSHPGPGQLLQGGGRFHTELAHAGPATPAGCSVPGGAFVGLWAPP